MAARILCVDDEDDICQLLDTILRMCGYQTLVASTAIEALARARSGPDLVILDINLPDFDGIEVCRQLRAYDPGVPVLFLTAATGARRREAMAAGGSAFLEKPFDVDELLDTIERLLGQRGERRSGRDRRQGADGHVGPERRVEERRAMWRNGQPGHAANPAVRNGHGVAASHPLAMERDGRPPADLRGRSTREG